MGSSQGLEEEVYDNLNLVNVVATSKYDRLVRDIYLKSIFAYEECEREVCKNLLLLDKKEIIDHYHQIRGITKQIERVTYKGLKEEDGLLKYINDCAYKSSAMVVQEKLTLQGREWVRNKTPMIFETLTIASENLHETKVRNFLKSYRRELRNNECKYLIVFEQGSKHGRPHFHVLYNKADRLDIISHGKWKGGRSDVRRVQYLGDGWSNQQEMLMLGYSVESVIGYMVKYISKDTSVKKETDMFNHRTAMSRGFGLCQMRKKLKKTKTQNLVRMIKSGMKPYMKVLMIEAQKELASRYSTPMKVLKRDLVTQAGAAILELLKGRELCIGATQDVTRELYSGWEDFRAIGESR